MLTESSRRDILLEKIVNALLEDGIVDMSLRPLAKTVGTSARLLIYHFETKERLLEEALGEIRKRIDDSVRKATSRLDANKLDTFLLAFWRWALQPESQKFFRLYYEISGLAMQGRRKSGSGSWGGGLTQWLRAFETAFTSISPDLHPGSSTLLLAALNGLLRDFMATGDRARTTTALHLLIEKMVVPSLQPRRSAKKGKA